MLKFEWDELKEKENIDKHGISFEQAILAFHDSDQIIEPDAKHSLDEPRYFCYGRTKNGILTVRFTRRGELIRIIGAAYWRKGAKRYEKEQKEE